MTSRKRIFAASFLLSAIISFIVSNQTGDPWEEYVRHALYNISGDSVTDYDVDMVDSNGIPYTSFSKLNGIEAGNQYNATMVCVYALNYFDSMQNSNTSRLHFNNCVRWLQKDMERHDNYALFRFHWQQPWYPAVKQPFTSGMTSALAMQVFTRAYSERKDSSLFKDAGMLLQGFGLTVDSGGFTYRGKEGWWYEELADTSGKTPRILDGHMFAMLGLYDYYEKTRNTLALNYFQKGFQALKNALPLYDAGNGEICYDVYCKHADKKYRWIITGQLAQLSKLTGDSTCLKYFKRWRKPLTRPYVWRAVRDRNRSGMIMLSLLWSIIFIVCLPVVQLSLKLMEKRPPGSTE